MIVATFLWGGNIIAAKVASNFFLEPIKLSFYRNIVIVLVLLPFVFNKLQVIYIIYKKNYKIILLLSLFGVAIFNPFMNIALTTSTVISTSLMPSFAPSLIILFSYYIYNSRISFSQIIGVIISFIGFVNIIIRGTN